MSDVLISAKDLEALSASDVVIIDTRNPDAYAAGHIPGAVNLHEIFTFLATSTPEGIAELKTKFADSFGKAGLSGKETAVFYEQSMNSGFGRKLVFFRRQTLDLDRCSKMLAHRCQNHCRKPCPDNHLRPVSHPHSPIRARPYGRPPAIGRAPISQAKS